MRPEQTIVEPAPTYNFNQWVKARGANWINILKDVYGPPEEGRHRATFIANDYVIKIPLNEYGVGDNEYEAQQSDPNLAQCHLVYDADDFPILIMEKVIMVPYNVLPGWAHNTDCSQVGLSKKTGKYGVYDLGLH